jgi:hypothetical protein
MSVPKRAVVIDVRGTVEDLITSSPSCLQGGAPWLVAFDDQAEGSKWAVDQTTDDKRQYDEEREGQGREQGNGEGPVGRTAASEFGKRAQHDEIAKK